MNYAIEILENRLKFIKEHVGTCFTEEMQKEYGLQKKDLELAIHNLKMLEP